MNNRRRCRELGKAGLGAREVAEDLAGDVALEDADDLGLGAAL
jgi:hypothetical protein